MLLARFFAGYPRDSFPALDHAWTFFAKRVPEVCYLNMQKERFIDIWKQMKLHYTTTTASSLFFIEFAAQEEILSCGMLNKFLSRFPSRSI